jgi:type I restriction enzyme S subunit
MNPAAHSSPSGNWIKHLPIDWKLSRLSNVADILFSNVDKITLDNETPVHLCNYVDVYKNNRITNKIEFMLASADEREIKRFQIMQGDVLATKDSETPEDIAIASLVSEDLPGVLCGYHLALIRPRKHLILGSYLSWLHSCKMFRSHYEANAIGVTRFGLSQAAFKEARVPIPPIPEQHRIAAYLDKGCAAIDSAVAAKQKQIETLNSLVTSIIHQAVTQGITSNVEMKPSGLDWLSEVPAHWQVQQIKRVCSLVRGQFSHRPRNDPAFYDGDYPFIQTGDITAANDVAEFSEIREIIGYIDKQLQKYRNRFY